MGTTKQIYFQDEISERLNKETNKSALINRLLKEHYDKADFLNMNSDELKIELKVRKLKRKMDLEIKELRNG